MHQHQVELIDGKAWYPRLSRALALVAAVFSQLNAGYAQQSAPELPTEPILRIEAGQHVAQIKRIDTDAANRFAATASDDKTVRVWSLPDGRLLRTLRLPIDSVNADIGKAYAVAMSPDGNTVAVGGYDPDIFLFDRGSGKLTQRFGDLPDGVAHLVYSSDGRRLAASLGGSNGVRVFDVDNGYRLLPSDAQYGNDSYSAQFDRAGRLVTTSDDGFVRLYAADHYGPRSQSSRRRGVNPTRPLFLPTAPALRLDTVKAPTWWFCRVRT